MIPLGVASPCSPVAPSTSAQVQPPPTRTVRACGSTWTCFSRERSITIPSSHGAEPGAVVAAAADGDHELVLAGEADGRGDVAGVAQRAISAGRLSIMAL